MDYTSNNRQPSTAIVSQQTQKTLINPVAGEILPKELLQGFK